MMPDAMHDRVLSDLRARLDAEVFAGDERSKPPPVLWHYTKDWGGLSGILTSKQIYARRSDKTNDDDELVRAERFVPDAIERVIPQPTTHANRLLSDFFVAWRRSLPAREESFVAAFTSEDDLVSMWRLYADEGRGFSIGVDPEAVRPGQAQISGENGSSGFLRVIYRDEEIRRSLAEDFASTSRVVSEAYAASPRRDVFATGYLYLGLAAGVMAMIAKHPSWRSEMEWRLFAFKPPAHMVQDNRCGVTLAPGGGRGHVREIVVGPRAKSGAVTRVEKLLRDLGYRDGEVAVRQSDAPLRI